MLDKTIIIICIVLSVVIGAILYKTKPDMILNNYEDRKIDFVKLISLSIASSVLISTFIFLYKKYRDNKPENNVTMGFKWNYFNY